MKLNWKLSSHQLLYKKFLKCISEFFVIEIWNVYSQIFETINRIKKTQGSNYGLNCKILSVRNYNIIILCQKLSFKQLNMWAYKMSLSIYVVIWSRILVICYQEIRFRDNPLIEADTTHTLALRRLRPLLWCRFQPILSCHKTTLTFHVEYKQIPWW